MRADGMFAMGIRISACTSVSIAFFWGGAIISLEKPSFSRQLLSDREGKMERFNSYFERLILKLYFWSCNTQALEEHLLN